MERGRAARVDHVGPFSTRLAMGGIFNNNLTLLAMENEKLAHHDTPREIVAACLPHETGTLPETNGMMKTQHQGIMLALAWAWCGGFLPAGAAEPTMFE